MRALSIRQPWLWAILFAGKDVENRPRKCYYRGPILLHASSSLGVQEHESAVRAITEMRAQARSPSDLRRPVPERPRPRPRKPGDPLPAVDPTTLPLGGLCGIARVVDCKFLESATSPKARARLTIRDLRIEAEGDVGSILSGLRGGPAGVTRG